MSRGQLRARPAEGGLRIEQVGKNIFEARPDLVYPVVATGVIQYNLDVNGFSIPRGYRLNKVEVKHTDDTGANTGTRWNCDLEMRDRRGGVWRTVFQRSVTADSILYECGEEYNWVGTQIRFVLNGPQGFLFYPLLTLQYLSGGEEA